MRRRQEEGMADAPHTHTHPVSSHIEYVSFNFWIKRQHDTLNPIKMNSISSQIIGPPGPAGKFSPDEKKNLESSNLWPHVD